MSPGFGPGPSPGLAPGFPAPHQAPPVAAVPGRGPLPGTPTSIAITPRPVWITIGLMLISAGILALVAYLPGSKPDPQHAVPGLREELYYAGNVAAVALIIIGLITAISNAFYRAQTEVLCRVCHSQVIGWKTTFGLQCPLEQHYAQVNWLGVIITTMFWIFGLGFAVVLFILPFA